MAGRIAFIDNSLVSQYVAPFQLADGACKVFAGASPGVYKVKEPASPDYNQSVTCKSDASSENAVQFEIAHFCGVGIPIDSYALKVVSDEYHDGQPVKPADVEAAFARFGEWKGMAFWFWDYGGSEE